MLVDNMFVFHADAVSAAVQSTRQAAATEVVRCSTNETEEENHARTHNNHTHAQAKDVQLSRVERHESRI